MSAKDAVIEFIRGLPDGATYPDIMAAVDTRFGMLDENGEELSAEEWDAAWIAEINRRVERIKSGQVQCIPHEEVMRQMREKYG